MPNQTDRVERIGGVMRRDWGLRRTSLWAFGASIVLGAVGLPCWLFGFMVGMSPHNPGPHPLFVIGLWCLLAALLCAGVSVVSGVLAMLKHHQPCPWVAAYAAAFILPMLGFVLWGLFGR